MKQILKGLKIASLVLFTLAFIGCEDDDLDLPKVEAGFTHTISQASGVVTFINTSTNANNYSWDFGDTTNSTEINPIHVYAAGTYTITLEASNVAGAKDTFQDTITITGGSSTGGNCTAETAQSLSASDFNLTFESDPSDVIVSDNAGFAWIDNPDVNTTLNNSCKVGQIDRTSASMFANNQINLDAKLDFNANSGFKLKVWAPTVGTNVLLKLEDQANSGTFFEVNATTTTANAWEELTFDFPSSESNKYDKLILFFELNTSTAATYYIDDFMLYTGGGTGATCTTETTESIASADLNITFLTNTAPTVEDNTTFSWIDNPDAAGTVNASCKVGQVVRSNNSPFDNIQYDLATKLDFNASEGIKMKVWSPVANTPILLKLEEIGNGGNFVEIQQTTTAANTWEELTFDFPATAAPQFNKMVIFFNFNVSDGSTYYFDDVMVYGTSTGGGCSAETTESTSASNLNITYQTNTAPTVEDNTTFAWIDNPDFAGTVNTSCKVGQVVRSNNSPFDNIQYDLANKLDFNTVDGLKMKVWSPIANTPILLKLEEIGNAGNFVEIQQTTTAANAWEELTFDFPATAAPQFNKMVIFFNFNVSDGSTYYVDDIMVYGSGGGTGGSCATPPAGEFVSDGGFEVNAGCWQLIDNGGLTTISTTINNGGSNSGQIKTTPGSNPALKQERFGIGTIQPNTTYVVTFDIQTNASDIPANGAVFQAFAFSEPAEGSTDGATQHILVAGDASFPTSWNARTYTFTTASNVDGGVSLLLELVCGGVPGCTGTVNIDNVSLVAQ